MEDPFAERFPCLTFNLTVFDGSCIVGYDESLLHMLLAGDVTKRVTITQVRGRSTRLFENS